MANADHVFKSATSGPRWIAAIAFGGNRYELGTRSGECRHRGDSNIDCPFLGATLL